MCVDVRRCTQAEWRKLIRNDVGSNMVFGLGKGIKLR